MKQPSKINHEHAPPPSILLGQLLLSFILSVILNHILFAQKESNNSEENHQTTPEPFSSTVNMYYNYWKQFVQRIFYWYPCYLFCQKLLFIFPYIILIPIIVNLESIVSSPKHTNFLLICSVILKKPYDWLGQCCNDFRWHNFDPSLTALLHLDLWIYFVFFIAFTYQVIHKQQHKEFLHLRFQMFWSKKHRIESAKKTASVGNSSSELAKEEEEQKQEWRQYFQKEYSKKEHIWALCIGIFEITMNYNIWKPYFLDTHTNPSQQDVTDFSVLDGYLFLLTIFNTILLVKSIRFLLFRNSHFA